MSNDKHVSGWVGWGVFAGVIILISGVFSAVQGLVAVIGPTASTEKMRPSRRSCGKTSSR